MLNCIFLYMNKRRHFKKHKQVTGRVRLYKTVCVRKMNDEESFSSQTDLPPCLLLLLASISNRRKWLVARRGSSPSVGV